MSPSRALSSAVAFSAVLLAGAAAHAADKDGAFAVKGIGGETCKQFSQGYQDRNQNIALFRSWLDGYLTSINRRDKDTFDIAPWQSSALLIALIEGHCRQSPEHRVADVVHALTEFLKSQKLAAKSGVVEAKAGDQSIKVYNVVMQRTQEALAKAGHYKGKPDGSFGPGTKAALEAFQEKSGLKKTGLPDQETLFKLLIEPLAKKSS